MANENRKSIQTPKLGLLVYHLQEMVSVLGALKWVSDDTIVEFSGNLPVTWRLLTVNGDLNCRETKTFLEHKHGAMALLEPMLLSDSPAVAGLVFEITKTLKALAYKQIDGVSVEWLEGDSDEFNEQLSLGNAKEIISKATEQLSRDAEIFNNMQSAKLPETLSAVQELFDTCSRLETSAVYSEDLLASIKEMHAALEAGCYISVMCLGGRIVEFALKHMLIVVKAKYDDSRDAIEALRIKVSQHPGVKLPPEFPLVVQTIQQYRNTYSHTREGSAFPSEDHVRIVVAGLRQLWFTAGTIKNPS